MKLSLVMCMEEVLAEAFEGGLAALRASTLASKL